MSVASASVRGMKRAYTASCTTTNRGHDLLTALGWALDQAEDGQKIVLWCWDKDTLPTDLVASAPSLGIIVRSERPRPRGGRPQPSYSGPVVAVDLPLETLIRIEPYEDPVCLVHAYVPENDEHGWIGAGDLPFDRPWIDAYRPTCLAGPTIVPHDPLIEDPVMAVAMESFTSTTNTGTTMHDYRDGDRVTSGLLQMRAGGHAIEPDRLFAAALQAGWKGPEAFQFWQVTREVSQGVKKRPKHHYRQDILARWRSEAAARAHPRKR